MLCSNKNYWLDEYLNWRCMTVNTELDGTCNVTGDIIKDCNDCIYKWKPILLPSGYSNLLLEQGEI